MKAVCSSETLSFIYLRMCTMLFQLGRLFWNKARLLVMPVSGSGGNRETAVGPPLNFTVEGFTLEMPNPFHCVEMRWLSDFCIGCHCPTGHDPRPDDCGNPLYLQQTHQTSVRITKAASLSSAWQDVRRFGGVVVWLNIAAFWIMTPCSLVGRYRRFGVMHLVRHQDRPVELASRLVGGIWGTKSDNASNFKVYVFRLHTGISYVDELAFGTISM